MRNHAQADEAEEINMTPMLDIVFIMLIFFIVTAVFVKEAGVSVDKPIAVSAELKQQAAVLIAVTSADQVWVNRKKVEIKALRTVLERLLAENPRGTVVIQADREAKSGITMQVMEAARQAGAPNVALSADQS
ncbi:MAG: biopolymer transporter ExbD [Sphingomonadales bacterium]|nr:biopolymer transporter ExbD [Sphingomonadales bacterium]